jgi:acyl-[acyl carrier protein]--UDP-N-acetylglucosamine O-acyltransferase
MSNIRKSFNFRNGVQVDEDNFIINSNGLVGIGTSIPTEALDVRGTAKVVGLATVDNLYAKNGTVGVLTITKLNGGGLSADTGIITSSSPAGVVTYYGDGGKLLNLPTSQWIDVDTGFGYTSIYAAGNVGVGTTYPDYTFQVGGTPGFKNGVGINSTGSIYLTGIITAGSHGIFGGSVIGLGIGSFASNLSAGGRLTVSAGATIGGGIVVSGGATVGRGITVTTFGYIGSDLVVGGGSTIGGTVNIGQSANVSNNLNVTNNATIGASATVGGGLVVGGGTTITDNLAVDGTGSIGGNVSIGGSLTIGYDVSAGLAASFGRNLVVGTSATVGGGLTVGGGTTIAHRLFVGRDINVGSSGTFGTNLFVTGITTLTGRLNVPSSAIIGNFELNVNPNTIFVSSGNLLINTSGGIVTVQDRLDVENELNVLQLLTATNGSVSNNVRVGTASSNRIDTSSGNLILGSNTNIIDLFNNLNVLGDLTVGAGASVVGSILTKKNLYVTGVSTFVGSVSSGQVIANNVRIGVVAANTIDSTSSELRLDSSQDKIRVLGDLDVDRNSYLTGITSISDLRPLSNLNGSIGSSDNRFGEAYIDEIRIGVSGTSVIDTLASSLELSSATGTIKLNNNTNILATSLQVGNPASLYLNSENKSIGIGTTGSTASLHVFTTSNDFIRLQKQSITKNINIGLLSGSNNPVISMGSSSVGSGKDNANITYDDLNLKITNEDFGDIEFILDNSSNAIGLANTGSFIFSHGRTSNDLVVIDYRGNLSISSDFSTSNNSIILSRSGNAYISSNFTVGQVLEINQSGNICTASNLDVTSQLTVDGAFTASSATSKLSANQLESQTSILVGVATESFNILYTITGNIGVQTSIITGINTSGLTVGLDLKEIVGVTLFGTQIFGFTNSPGQVELTESTLNLSPISSQSFDFGNFVSFGYSTQAVADFSQAGADSGLGLLDKRFMLPPIVTTAERVGLSTRAGAIIYNSTTNKHQGYNGTAWFDFY